MSGDALREIRRILAERRSAREALDVEIAELETAERVVLRYAPDDLRESLADANGTTEADDSAEDSPSPGNRVGMRVAADAPLAGKSIRDAAKVVLSSADREMSYTDVAQHAVELGYRSRDGSSDLSKIAPSFYEMMRRYPDDFERRSHLFRLRVGGPASNHGINRLKKIEAVELALRELDRPSSIPDIYDKLIDMGYKQYRLGRASGCKSMNSTLRSS
jgi:hypothetical protein